MVQSKLTYGNEMDTIPEGKVIDFITGKLLNDNEEEYVRQNIEKSLVIEYKYPLKDMDIETRIQMGSGYKQADICVFHSGKKHIQQNAVIIIETKKMGTKPNDPDNGIPQLQSYMAATASAKYGLWTNGEGRYCLVKDEKEGVIEFNSIPDIPSHGQKSITRITRKDLRPATGSNLLFAFRRTHNYIAGNTGLQKPDAFWELLKIIFCKIEDERSTGELKFYVDTNERESLNGQLKVKSRVDDLYQEVAKGYKKIFNKSDTWVMSASCIAYTVEQLQMYSLLSTQVDVKGIAYEEIVGSNLRGDRGEFFTPRNAVEMTIRMLSPQKDEKLIDPACGTGGFLINAMNYVLRHIKDNADALHGKHSEEALMEFYRERQFYLNNNIFGLDINPNLVKACKMNMVMNNDGSGTLYQSNSLENPHVWENEPRDQIHLNSFDLVVTNPPFGTKIVIDDPRILRQYDLAHVWDKQSDGSYMMLDRLQPSMPPEILFIERCMQFLKPGKGRMGIVLPNGILNNVKLEYIRYWLLSHAHIFAVVDMNRDLFQPKNDTQTSILIMGRRESPIEDISSLNYQIFFAIADMVGHDKRGNPIYKRTPDGKEIIERKQITLEQIIHGIPTNIIYTSAEPVIDDNTMQIAEQFLEWVNESYAIRRQ